MLRKHYCQYLEFSAAEDHERWKESRRTSTVLIAAAWSEKQTCSSRRLFKVSLQKAVLFLQNEDFLHEHWCCQELGVATWRWCAQGHPPVSTHKLSRVTHATSWVEALRRGIHPAQILTAVSGSIGGTAVVSEGHRSDGMQILSIDGMC